MGAPRAPVQPVAGEAGVSDGSSCGRRVHRLVGQSVGVGVLGPRDPRVADLLEPRAERLRLLEQRPQVGMLDLPAAGHLLHHQLGVHPHLDLGGAQFGRLLQSGNQTAVLGDVVGGMPDRLLALGQHRAAVGRPHHRAVSRRARVATGPAVGLDDHLHWSPPETRNRIAPHSGHRNTSSSAAAEIRASSPRSISIRHAPHRRPCSRPAPGPPWDRWRS